MRFILSIPYSLLPLELTVIDREASFKHLNLIVKSYHDFLEINYSEF